MKFKHGVIYNGRLYRAGTDVPIIKKNTKETAKSVDVEVSTINTGQTAADETTEKPKRKRKKAAETESGVVNDGCSS